MRIVMMGTGTFALPAFRTLLESAEEVVGLVTQPDRTGRGHHRHVNPLKELALQHPVAILQPQNVNSPTALDDLRGLSADLFVVAAYGQILSPELLAIPRLGAINLHGSLLPKYRGAAPVQYAVLHGDRESGVTIFQIEPRLDSGPILGTVSTPISPQETSGQLHDRLADLAAPLLMEVVAGLKTGSITKCSQDPSQVTRAPKIKKEQGLIDWTKSSQEIGWHVRGMQPWPMPYSFLHIPDRAPQRVLVLEVELRPDVVSDDQSEAAAVQSVPESRRYPPGACLPNESGKMLIRTGDGAVEITRLQPAGKRAMSAEEYLCGTSLTGAVFRQA